MNMRVAYPVPVSSSINTFRLNKENPLIITSKPDKFIRKNVLSFQGRLKKDKLLNTIKNNSSNVIFVAGTQSASVSFQGKDVTGKNILVTGGAGYIGSHTAKYLLEKGYDVVVLDNLSLGNQGAIKELEKIAKEQDRNFRFYKADLADTEQVAKIFQDNNIDAVVHFAACSQVSESVKDPLKYYINNTAKTALLLKEMINANVKKIVFSSTASTYGIPCEDDIPIKETCSQNPINPYGASKLMIEKILDEVDIAHGVKSIRLRYFNVAGASSDGRLGEVHDPETHLIPNVLKPALDNMRGEGEVQEFKMFGTDYPTKDGTCVRDYIHIEDLAKAHELALQKLFNGGNTSFYNLGSGKGYSVKEVHDTCEDVIGFEIPVKVKDRREGDPPVLLASNEKVKAELGWIPEKTLEDMVRTTWNWMQNPRF